jgi:arsenate reductase (glutaredoxin)
VIHRRDFFRDRFSPDELRQLLHGASVSPRDVLSTRSKAYRARAEAIDSLTDEALIEAMVDEPTLLRRPLVLRGGELIIGMNNTSLARLAGKNDADEE